MEEIRKELKEMPSDHGFWLEDGNYSLCHATGYQVIFEGEDEYWNEYIDSFGNFHYGR